MATARENLEDFITCSVCLEKFEGRDPRSLPCLHAFCLTCIQDIHRIATANQDNKLNDDEFRCPQCTTISNIPGKSVDNFPKFFYASHIHDVIKGKNPKVCQNDKREVRGYCFTCTRAFCDRCLHRHNKNARYKNHVHTMVTKDNAKALVCTVHDEMVEAFCTDCCEAVCAQCQLAEHEDHSLSDFVISVQRPSTNLREIACKQETCKDKIWKLETMQKEFNAHITGVQEEIEKHREHLITQINEQSQVMQSELAKHQTDTNIEIENLKTDLKESNEMMTLDQARMTLLVKPVPELPSVSLHNMEQLISDIKQQIPEMPQLNVDVKDAQRYQFIPQSADVKLGTLTALRESLQNPKPSPRQNTHCDVKQKDANYTQQQLVTQPKLVKQPQLITQICTDHINDLSWTPSGDVLLAAGSKKLAMYNTQGEELPAPCGLKGSVWSVDVHQTELIVALVVGNSLSNLHLCITSLGKCKPQWLCRLPSYSKVTFTADGYVLAYYEENRLLKYSIKGDKLWERKVKHNVDYATTTPDNKIIISGDKQLSVLDKDGQRCSYFPRDTTTLIEPRGVCTDSNGHVFVADYEKRAVLMYTSHGTYVREVVTVDGLPESLALYEDRYLAVEVMDYIQPKLHVYDIK